MSRKSPKQKRKAKTKPQPELAQLRAVERLLVSKDHKQALRRLQPLLKRFPDHATLQSWHIEALHEVEGPKSAAVAVYEWAERRQGSLQAQQYLLDYAIDGGYLILADHVAARIRALGGATPGFPLSDEILTDLCEATRAGPIAPDVLLPFDIARLYMGATRFTEAVRHLEGVDLLNARNNHGVCLFHLGDVERALDIFLDAWRRDSENLFACGWIVLLQRYLGAECGPPELIEALNASTARRDDDAVGQIQGLLLLDEPEQAWDAHQRVIATDWWAGIRSATDAHIAHLGACAAARTGRTDEARRLWQAAEDRHPGATPAAQNLNAMRTLEGQVEGTDALVRMIDLQQGLPVGVLTRIREHPEDVDANIIALNVSDAYLDMLYRRGTEHAATAVRLMLKHRTRMQDEAAASLLRDHLRLPIGSSEDRHGMLTELRDGGFIGRDEVVDFWDRGKLTQLRLFSIEVHREPSESRLPPELEPLMDASVTASYEGRRKDAEAPLRTILEKLPNHPVALGNLAVLRGADGAQDEATALLEQAVKADPNYLFARCSLARQRIQAGDLDAADALLEGHMEHRRIHIQDLINLYGALAMLSSARGDNAQARGFLDTLKPLIQDDNEAKRLTEARILAIRASPDGSLMRELFSDALTDED